MTSSETTSTQPKGSGLIYRLRALVVVVLSLLPWLAPLAKTTTPSHDSAWSSSTSDGPSLRATSLSPSLPSGPLPLPPLSSIAIALVVFALLVGAENIGLSVALVTRLWLWQRRLLL
jgi:hypothetical protein